ncbi:MAG TPA: glycosyltransferase [Longimicrobiales bacterium]
MPQPSSKSRGPSETRIVFIAYDAEGHVGRHLTEAADKMRIQYRVMSPTLAFDAPWLVAKFNWHLRGHRPTRLDQFGKRAAELCSAIDATHLVATGIAPLSAPALRAIRASGVKCVNWLTDDPWNAAHRAPWFLESITEYNTIFTPRSAVVDDLRHAGVRNIGIMPFAYCGACHFAGKKREQRTAISFVGGADHDRVRYVDALVKANITVELYGGYWQEQRGLAQFAGGFVDTAGYRAVVAGTAASLCLVREANRDGHVMRSYELPAMRGCILAQDTPDHRELYGPDGETVRYFTSVKDIGSTAHGLLNDAAERDRLGVAVHARVAQPENSYYTRLAQLIG